MPVSWFHFCLYHVEELRSKLDQQSADVVTLHPFGYVATMNKQSKQRRGCRYDDLVEQAVRERQWFESKGFGSDPRASVAALVARLTHMYHEYVVNTWLPGAIQTIQAEIDRLRLRENDFGFPRAHDLAFIDPVGLSEAAHSRFQQLLGEPALATLCTRMHAEVLKNRQLFETVESPQPIWRLESLLAACRERRAVQLQAALGRCAQLCQQYTHTLLASDDSSFRFGRFDRVIERIDAHVKQLLEDWQGEVQATLMGVIQDYHRMDCSPHITLTHSLGASGATATAPAATVRCQVDYSKLNLTVCQLVMEGICKCLLELQWERPVPDADDPELWLESWAAERTELLGRLDKATKAKRRLQELAQEVEAAQRRTNLARLQAATRMGNMRQVSASAPWLAEHLRRLPSRSICGSLCDHGAVGVVHAALERRMLQLAPAEDALPALLHCMRWLCNHGSNDNDDLRESEVLVNLERAHELGTVQQVCTVLSHENPAVVSAALECMTILSTSPDLASTTVDSAEVELAMQTMGRHLADPGVAEHGCRLVSALSGNGTSAERLIQAGVCQAVTRALEQNLSTAAVVQWACRAIVTLCEINTDNVVRFQATCVQEVVARALEQHARGGEAFAWARRARTHLQAILGRRVRRHVVRNMS